MPGPLRFLEKGLGQGFRERYSHSALSSSAKEALRLRRLSRVPNAASMSSAAPPQIIHESVRDLSQP